MHQWIISACTLLLLAGCANQPPRSPTADKPAQDGGYAALLTAKDARTFNYAVHRPDMPPPPSHCHDGYHKEAFETADMAGGGYFVLVLGCIPDGYHAAPPSAIEPNPMAASPADAPKR